MCSMHTCRAISAECWSFFLRWLRKEFEFCVEMNAGRPSGPRELCYLVCVCQNDSFSFCDACVCCWEHVVHVSSLRYGLSGKDIYIVFFVFSLLGYFSHTHMVYSLTSGHIITLNATSSFQSNSSINWLNWKKNTHRKIGHFRWMDTQFTCAIHFNWPSERKKIAGKEKTVYGYTYTHKTIYL